MRLLEAKREMLDMADVLQQADEVNMTSDFYWLPQHGSTVRNFVWTPVGSFAFAAGDAGVPPTAKGRRLSTSCSANLGCFKRLKLAAGAGCGRFSLEG